MLLVAASAIVAIGLLLILVQSRRSSSANLVSHASLRANDLGPSWVGVDNSVTVRGFLGLGSTPTTAPGCATTIEARDAAVARLDATDEMVARSGNDSFSSVVYAVRSGSEAGRLVAVYQSTLYQQCFIQALSIPSQAMRRSGIDLHAFVTGLPVAGASAAYQFSSVATKLNLTVYTDLVIIQAGPLVEELHFVTPTRPPSMAFVGQICSLADKELLVANETRSA